MTHVINSKWLYFSIFTFLTILSTLGIVIYAICKNKKTSSVLITALITDVILISSFYGIMNVGKAKNLWSLIDTPSYLFLSIFLKVLLAFIIYILVQLMIHPENLSEFATKLFGVEFSFKKEVKNALKDFEQAKKQIKYLSDLNNITAEYIAQPFETKILNGTKPIGEEIRLVIKDFLLSVYDSNSKVNVTVVSITDETINNLDEHIAALVRINIEKNVNNFSDVYDDVIGIAVFRETLKNDETLIIMDARNADCIFTVGEIDAISNMYLSIATIISWAGKV
jgi:hypothetical protein